MPAMSGRLVGPAQLVSAAILGSADPGQTSADHADGFVDGNVATLTASSPSSPSDFLGWWILVRDRHSVRPAFCACWVTALEGGRAKDWPPGWAFQAAERPSCGISYGTSFCPTVLLLGSSGSTNGRQRRAFASAPS